MFSQTNFSTLTIQNPKTAKMNIVLIDLDKDWKNFLPLTFTRPISELRIGILTIKEKWERLLGAKAYYLTQDYLQEKYPLKLESQNIVINSTLLPNNQIINEIKQLPDNTIFTNNGQLLFGKVTKEKFDPANLLKLQTAEFDGEIWQIQYPWDIFLENERAIEQDFKLITQNRKSQKLSHTNIVFEPERIFVEPGAWVEGSILNPNGGYIYIGRDSTIMEGTTIRGSLALCEHSVIKMQAKIYGATTFGPYSKVGGEVSNSVIIGYSNKAHDGFLGNAVLGHWCNLGADTNNSNLKNNYSEVKVWNYTQERFIRSGHQFVGLFMGDHSKTGINTMLNTGTVVGVSANIFGAGYPRNFIPSFSWGGYQGFTVYRLEKALDTAGRVMIRRQKQLTETDKKILSHIFKITEKYRNF